MADAAAHAAYAPYLAGLGLTLPLQGFAHKVGNFLRRRAYGQYHLAMQKCLAAGEDEDEERLAREYDSPEARYAAIRSVTHPFAPLRLLLQTPAEALAEEEASSTLECTTCDSCRKTCTTDELKACSACMVDRYCSTACQKNAWKAHKPYCLKWRAAAAMNSQE